MPIFSSLLAAARQNYSLDCLASVISISAAMLIFSSLLSAAVVFTFEASSPSLFELIELIAYLLRGLLVSTNCATKDSPLPPPTAVSSLCVSTPRPRASH